MKKRVHFFLGVLFIFFLTLAFELPTPPPPGEMGPYLNGVFPTTSPNSNWEFEDPFPDFKFKTPLRLEPFLGTDDHLLLCKSGEVWRLSFENGTRERVLDIRNITMDRSEAGSVGMALHPKFGDPSQPDKQALFIFYRTKPSPEVYEHPGFNRLSKFMWDEQTGLFDPTSEEILIQQYDRNAWHNGGGMFFGNDGFLYISLGDEGILDGYPAHLPVSTQRLDLGLFNGVIRIDVDNDPSRSHPIRRQPQSPDTPPAGYEGSYTQGYSIPNDNPWLDPDGGILEEFFALGIRSPYSMSYDAVEDMIWLSDVGADKREEISIVEKGDNLQWPYMEGTLQSLVADKPANLIGNEKPPHWDYPRSVGTCIIGGGVYRGEQFPQLKDKFLFADWNTNRMMAVPVPGSTPSVTSEVLIDNISATGVAIPENPGFTGVFPMANGEVMVSMMTHWQLEEGKIFRLVGKVQAPTAIEKLSELGAFTDLETLTPVTGLIPYKVNSPLWSDRAVKKRWMALPNDGQFDRAEEQITFSESGEWEFPAGTVFVKHFDLPRTTDPNGETFRVETRFFIIDENGTGYGLTYKWNDEGNEAYLQKEASSKDFEITEGGMPVFTQTWDYPSSAQCLSCHNDASKYVLGLNTHQLNGEIEYPSLGHSMNQLDYLDQLGAFDRTIKNAENYRASAAIDDASADLDTRVRSYLDSNCSSCHRPGGVNQVSLDFRFNIPLSLQNMVNVTAQSHASGLGRFLVEPGSHASSEVWIRDASNSENRMPPLARNMVDEVYIEALAEWIDGLPTDTEASQEILLYPNPTSDWLSVWVGNAWTTPVQVKIYSMTGQLLYRSGNESSSIQIDLTNYPAATYVVEISDGENREVEQFVKR